MYLTPQSKLCQNRVWKPVTDYFLSVRVAKLIPRFTGLEARADRYACRSLGSRKAHTPVHGAERPIGQLTLFSKSTVAKLTPRFMGIQQSFLASNQVILTRLKPDTGKLRPHFKLSTFRLQKQRSDGYTWFYRHGREYLQQNSPSAQAPVFFQQSGELTRAR